MAARRRQAPEHPKKFTTTFHMQDKLCFWTGGANRRGGADSCHGAAVQRMDPWDHATRARRRSWAEAPDLHGTHAPPTRSGARQLFASRRGGDGRQAAQAGQPLVCEIAGGSPLLWEKNTSNEGVNKQGKATASSPCQASTPVARSKTHRPLVQKRTLAVNVSRWAPRASTPATATPPPTRSSAWPWGHEMRRYMPLSSG